MLSSSQRILTSMFLVVHDPINSTQKLNNDIYKVRVWANKWKMSFNPDPFKEAQGVIFSRKIRKVYLQLLLLNNFIVFNKYHLKKH